MSLMALAVNVNAQFTTAPTFTGPDLSFDTQIWPIWATVKMPVFYKPQELWAMKESSERGKASVYVHYSLPKYTHLTAQKDLHWEPACLC